MGMGRERVYGGGCNAWLHCGERTEWKEKPRGGKESCCPDGDGDGDGDPAGQQLCRKIPRPRPAEPAAGVG